ncbi:MAG: alkaline phosphatase family protein [Anaerolineales bacterium]|nr:alkaline phosphatase family protein [Anaerolineales bacterium]
MMKKNIVWILAAVLFLSACQPAAAPPIPKPSPTFIQPPATQTPFLPATATATFLPPTATTIPRPTVDRVLIITVDGLRPDAIALAPMPNLLALMEAGAYSLTAQTVFRSVTLIAHASMVTSMCPNKHGIDWNDYRPENGFANGPTIFDIAHQAGLKTVMVVGKKKLRQITVEESTDIYYYVNDRDSVVAERAVPLINEGFDLMFVHLPLVDILGHEYGWLSPNQLTGAFRADEAIGMLLAALDEAGLRQGTLIIITADHGGHETSPGSRLVEDMSVPWIITGAGQTSMELTRPISVVDTAATAAFALNLPIPAIWDGIPVSEFFGAAAPVRAELPCQ